VVVVVVVVVVCLLFFNGVMTLLVEAVDGAFNVVWF
jgi:hypothetical protein